MSTPYSRLIREAFDELGWDADARDVSALIGSVTRYESHAPMPLSAYYINVVRRDHLRKLADENRKEN